MFSVYANFWGMANCGCYIIMTMKIAVGTTSVLKLEYLNEVLAEFGIDSEVFPAEVQSEISEQPLTAEETLIGSINRANNAMRIFPDVDMALGMEVGYHPNIDDKYEIFCYTTLIDKTGTQISCESQRFLLPDFHQAILREDKVMGDYVYDYVKESDDKNGILIATRKPYICDSLKKVILEWKR